MIKQEKKPQLRLFLRLRYWCSEFSVLVQNNKTFLDRAAHVPVNTAATASAESPGLTAAVIPVESGLHQCSDHAITDQKCVPDYVHTRRVPHHVAAVLNNRSGA